MDKTGESYTAARAQILKLSTPPDDRLAELGGMSDEAVAKKTGRTWKTEWVRELDGFDAISLTHREIAKRVVDEYEISAWWAQTVTVGYERIRGLREIGQRRDTKAFEASKSKTFAGWSSASSTRPGADETLREAWLPGVDFEIRAQDLRTSRYGSRGPTTRRCTSTFTTKVIRRASSSSQHVGLRGQG